jgi:hypothetical protein
MSRARRLAGVLASALATAACGPRLDDGGTGPPAVAEVVAYDITIMAPDACYRAEPGETVTWAEGTLSIRRVLSRAEGFCAQVMTPVRFTGRAESRGPVRRAVLEVMAPDGKVLDSIPIR